MHLISEYVEFCRQTQANYIGIKPDMQKHSVKVLRIFLKAKILLIRSRLHNEDIGDGWITSSLLLLWYCVYNGTLSVCNEIDGVRQKNMIHVPEIIFQRWWYIYMPINAPGESVIMYWGSRITLVNYLMLQINCVLWLVHVSIHIRNRVPCETHYTSSMQSWSQRVNGIGSYRGCMMDFQ